MTVSTSFTGNLGGQLPETYVLPESLDDTIKRIRQYMNDTAYAVNRKDSGYYVEEETVTGQKFVPTFGTAQSSNVEYRPVLRKVIDTGTLPSTATSTTAHGITTNQDFSFVKIYGCATDPGASTVASAIPLPYINTTTPGDSVELSVDATNVNITTTTANYAVYTRSFVILEWIQTV